MSRASRWGEITGRWTARVICANVALLAVGWFVVIDFEVARLLWAAFRWLVARG